MKRRRGGAGRRNIFSIVHTPSKTPSRSDLNFLSDFYCEDKQELFNLFTFKTTVSLYFFFYSSLVSFFLAFVVCFFPRVMFKSVSNMTAYDVSSRCVEFIKGE